MAREDLIGLTTENSATAGRTWNTDRRSPKANQRHQPVATPRVQAVSWSDRVRLRGARYLVANSRIVAS